MAPRIIPVFVLAWTVFAGVPLQMDALPHRDKPIDATKRAPVSTQDAVRPSARPPAGSGVVGSGRVPVARVTATQGVIAVPTAPITVSETRGKKMKKVPVRQHGAARTFSRQNPADHRAAIPRLESRQFQRLLNDYRAGRRSILALNQKRAPIGKPSADMADINRFASPRAALERQGIPVVSAGSGSAPDGSSSQTVPLSGADASPARAKSDE